MKFFHKRNFFILLFVVCTACWVYSCDSSTSSDPKNLKKADQGPSSKLDRVLAELEGTPVSEQDYKNYLLERFGENQFETYLEEKILTLKAKEMKIGVSEVEIQEEVEKNYDSLLKTRFGGNELAMRSALSERGMTLEGWKKDLFQRTQRHQLLDQMVKKLRTPESEIVKNKFNQMYGENGLKIRVRHILISNKILNSRFYSKEEFEFQKQAIDLELKNFAQDLVYKIKQGEDFGELARQHSDDFTASRGGELGDAWKGRYGVEFDQAVANLPIQQVSNLIKTDKGYHIVKVTSLQKGVEYQGSAILVSNAPQGSIDQRTQEDRDKESLEKAKNILKELQEGGVFSEIAKQKSDDVATKGRGGDLGLFGRRRLGAEVSAVLDQMQPGTISEPIQTSRGYWIIKLDQKKLDPNQDQKIVSHIYLSSQYEDVKKKKLSATIDSLSSKKAEDLLNKIKSGTDFKEIANQESEDAYTKKAGGEYYNYQKSSLGPEIWDAVQTMSPNEDLKIVKSDRGYHIVQVMERQQTRFEDVKHDLLIEINEQPIGPGDAKAMMDTLKSEVRLVRHYGSVPQSNSAGPSPGPTPSDAGELDLGLDP
jgi:parvulin-like peptidyl-prolyl isomerase